MARVNFMLVNGEFAVVEIPRHVLERLIVRGQRALDGAPLPPRGRSRGWISDQIGREYTMAIAFGLGGIAYWLLGTLGHAPWAFVLFAALIFLTWGEIFSLFPSTCTDTFGTKFATVNLSLLYTAKGASAFLVPVANVIKSATGGWHLVFVLTAIMNFVVVGLALFVLKPLRERFVANG
jgi:OFA family oxalate/formate antiporter-like MFS transporter